MRMPDRTPISFTAAVAADNWPAAPRGGFFSFGGVFGSTKVLGARLIQIQEAHFETARLLLARVFHRLQ